MHFTSFTFALFLAGVFLVYWKLRLRSRQNGFLILASYFFYAWWDYRFCSLMAISTLVDFAAAIGIQRSERPRVRRGFLVLSLVLNLSLLGFFKYFNFFTENLATLLQGLGWVGNVQTLCIILPIGISFYTFQTMSYTIDVYRGRLPACTALVDYAAYVSFFPQLVAGPIERGARLLPQFQRDRVFSRSRAVDGCRQILWGLLKKIVVADSLALMVDPIYAQPDKWTGPQLLVATIAFSFQIYCDFSAYSDIAIGTARLLGFDLMRNFAFPYFSQNVAEFWHRWHISLSTWFRDYVYLPLGGSKCARYLVVRNVLVTFVISGLWHGASWKFVLWGAIHGIGLIVHMFWRNRPVLRAGDTPAGPGLWPGIQPLLKIAATFCLVSTAWVFFRATTLTDATEILRRIAGDLFRPEAYRFQGLEIGRQLRAAVTIIPTLLILEWISRRHPHPLHLITGWPRLCRWLLYSLILWLIIYFTPEQSSEFIYFQF